MCSIKKAGLSLILFILTSCSTKKTVIVIPEHNVVIEDKSVLCSDFEKNIVNIRFTLLSIVKFFLLKLEIGFKDRRGGSFILMIATIEGHCDERG